MYGYYFDPTYILLVIGMVLSLAASAKVKGTLRSTAKSTVLPVLQERRLHSRFCIWQESQMFLWWLLQEV